MTTKSDTEFNPMLKRANQSSLLGMSLSSTAVNLLELKPHAKGYEIIAFGTAAIPDEAYRGAIIQDPSAVATAIQLAYQQSGSSSKQVVTALSDTLVLSKRVYLEKPLAGDALRTEVTRQTEQFLPYPLTQAALDYTVLTPCHGKESQHELLLVGARQEHIDLFDGVIRMAGLVPQIIEVESFALERAYRLLLIKPLEICATTITAAIDIGVMGTNTIVFLGDHAIFFREETLHLPALVNYARTHTASHIDTETLCDNVIALIKHTLAFFHNIKQIQTIDQLIISGIGATLPGLVTKIIAVFNCPTTLARPFTTGKIVGANPAMIDDIYATSLMLTCGLALRQFEHALY